MTSEGVRTHELHGTDGAFTVYVLDDVPGPNPPAAAVFGDVSDDCLVRVHSRCLYGEIFASNDCDCREQLHKSLELIREEGAGVLIYLDQEGRGAGLGVKARGYEVSQLLGLDTYESYAHLNVAADSRTYEHAARLLSVLQLERVRLLTNNPAKVAALEAEGIVVKREELVVDHPGEHTVRYLQAKERHGHAILPAGTFA
ncbi:GTP cyclohydrolase II [Amycolatopsis sp. FDAARGOS 1241]|uniref:GTP cyclohydrolase II n=1 Tax=Amycolatopsis sp. FDAARGOS 1241 TaxID=2778070 RepID=UPI00194F31F2|nr:GTP cyclohydrolase II [Amycolatopsis sp. FDAARGOS 1241]QRP44856.1 GTP cyclohydrolase II [Amycolatopsis sp. FDAARGOS 1241]